MISGEATDRCRQGPGAGGRCRRPPGAQRSVDDEQQPVRRAATGAGDLAGGGVVDQVVADLLGVKDGLAPSTSAEAPATCGEAIDVPLMVLVAVLLEYQAEVIDVPGAKMSRQVP
ncbi:hypothetical protein GCM10027605_50320 [Micromonospora zhanjiangensis]